MNSCLYVCVLQVRENETDEERKVRLEMESLQADEKETRQQVSWMHCRGTFAYIDFFLASAKWHTSAHSHATWKRHLLSCEH